MTSKRALLAWGVLSFFGAPITHEDDPIRAAHAAMDIQESFKEYSQELAGTVDDFQIRIGISTGRVETWVRNIVWLILPRN